MDRQGCETRFKNGVCEILRSSDQKLILRAETIGKEGLYALSQGEFEDQMGLAHQLCMAHSIRTDAVSRLHYILNHASAQRCNYECTCHKFPGITTPFTEKMKDVIRQCVFCHMAKGKHRPTCQTMERHPVPGKSWSVDVKGPIATPSLEYGNIYIAGFIENNSRFAVKGFMKKKSDIYAVTVFWHDTYIVPLRKSHPELGKIFVHSDNGEFNSEVIQSYLLKNGVYSMLVCPYTPQHNGIIERLWQTLMNATIALLLTAGLGEEYWQEAFGCAVHVYNRMSCAHPQKYPKSPFETFMEFKPIIGHFQPWGVLAFALRKKSKKDLLEKAELCVHMGYQDRHQVGYRLLALQTNEFIITNNATFVLSSEILVKDLYGKELTDARQEQLYQMLCHSSSSVTESTGEKSYGKQTQAQDRRITRYPIRSMLKESTVREPTITYSGMIPGEEPPYRPLVTEQIDIEQGLQELGVVCSGLIPVEEALEDWQEYHKPRRSGELKYLYQCIQDWDSRDLLDANEYSWEGENYSRGLSPHLLGWSEEEGQCIRPLMMKVLSPRGHVISKSTCIPDRMGGDGGKLLGSVPSPGGAVMIRKSTELGKYSSLYDDPVGDSLVPWKDEKQSRSSPLNSDQPPRLGLASNVISGVKVLEGMANLELAPGDRPCTPLTASGSVDCTRTSERTGLSPGEVSVPASAELVPGSWSSFLVGPDQPVPGGMRQDAILDDYGIRPMTNKGVQIPTPRRDSSNPQKYIGGGNTRGLTKPQAIISDSRQPGGYTDRDRSLACTSRQYLESGNSLGKQNITLLGPADAIGLEKRKSGKLGPLLDDFPRKKNLITLSGKSPVGLATHEDRSDESHLGLVPQFAEKVGKRGPTGVVSYYPDSGKHEPHSAAGKHVPPDCANSDTWDPSVLRKVGKHGPAASEKVGKLGPSSCEKVGKLGPSVLGKDGTLVSCVCDREVIPIAHVSGGKLGPPREIGAVHVEPTEDIIDLITPESSEFKAVKRKLTELNYRSGYGSYATGVVAGKLTRHTVSELQSGWGPTWTQKVTELQEDKSRSDDREEERLRSNTGFNQTALLGKDFLQLSSPVGMKRLKRVRLSEIALSDDGSSQALKTKSNHNVLRSVVRKAPEVDTKESYADQEDLPGVQSATQEDTNTLGSMKAHREERQESSNTEALLPGELRDEYCCARNVAHLRHTIHEDPESGLIFYVSSVYDDKVKRLTVCERMLVLPTGEIVSSTLSLVPAAQLIDLEILDLQIGPVPCHHYNTRGSDNERVDNPELNLMSIEGEENSYILRSLRKARGLNHDRMADYCLTIEAPVIDHRVPLTHNEAMLLPSSGLWREAEETELQSLNSNKVLLPSVLPPGQKLMHTKWIYALKYDTEGNIIKRKARLVAQGFRQVFGVNFDETYAPVTTLDTLRLILALAAQLGLVVHQMDVVTAFLNAKLEEEMYIKPPLGIPLPSNSNCFRLMKALYGLKQSPRQWYKDIDGFLLQANFKSLPNEPCLYYRQYQGSLNLISLYVDDLVIAGRKEAVDNVKTLMLRKYKMKDLGEIHLILGCEVKYDRVSGDYSLNQRHYVIDLCKKFLPLGGARVQTPMSEETLTKEMSPSTDEQKKAMQGVPYRQLIGSLLWLVTGSRLDIAFAVSCCAKYCMNPGMAHWTAVLRILRYLNGTRSYGLVYRRVPRPVDFGCYAEKEPEYQLDNEFLPNGEVGFKLGQLHIYVHVDSDHARDLDTRRSVTACIVFGNGTAVSWKSKMQPTVAKSSMEAEYMALCFATCEILSLNTTVMRIGYAKQRPISVYEDNQSAIYFSRNNTDNLRTKHIDVQYHFVREQLVAGLMSILKIPTKENTADLLTKPLSTEVHWRHMATLMVNIYPEDIGLDVP